MVGNLNSGLSCIITTVTIAKKNQETFFQIWQSQEKNQEKD